MKREKDRRKGTEVKEERGDAGRVEGEIRRESEKCEG